MAMLVTDAKIYVARIVGGGAQSQQSLDLAGEAILRSYQDWENAKFWQFLLKDTSLTTSVTGCTATLAALIVSAPTVGAFDFVNVGQTVTVPTGTATLAASTTVASLTRGSDGVVTSITLSAAFGGTTNVNATLVFSADIPVLVGVDEYNLPSDFSSAYSARMTLDPKGALQYTDQKSWDRMQDDHSVQLPVDGYTTYNPVSAATQNYGTYRLKLFGLPDKYNILRLRYFRNFITNGTYIDMPNEFLYKFLDYARKIMLAAKRAQDSPGEYAAEINQSYAETMAADEQHDEDEEQRMKSPYERTVSRPIVGNGQFNPDRI